MISINLSGIQSIVVPLSIEVGDEVLVFHEEDNKYQQKEIALAAKHDAGIIGYVPCLETIEKYIKKAEKDNDLRAFRNQSERYRITSHIRDNVINDIYRNNQSVRAKIGRVQLNDDQDKVLSVSISFDYM